VTRLLAPRASFHDVSVLANPPQFSIITCSFQASRFVRRCHWSLAQQETTDWEWIIVDDASMDDTAEVVRALGDSRIRYMRLETNVGRGRARLYALQHARGHWIAVHDMDDVSFPDRLSRAQQAMSNGYDYLCSPVALIDNHYRLTGVRGLQNAGYPKAFVHATLCGDTELVRRIGYPPYRRAQDVTLVYTLANNYRGCFCPDPLYVYHENASVTLYGAIQGQYYFFKQLRELVESGMVKRTYEVRRMQIIRLLKLVGLLPFWLCPPLYRKTIAWRDSQPMSVTCMGDHRSEFIRRCAQLHPIDVQPRET